MGKYDYLKECWKHAKTHWIAFVVAILSGAYTLLSNYGPILSLPEKAKVEKWPKLPLPWALVLIIGAFCWILLEGGIRYAKSRETSFSAHSENLNSIIHDLRGELTRTKEKLHNIEGPELNVVYDIGTISDSMNWPLAIQNLKGGIAYRVRVEGIGYGGLSATIDEVSLIRDGEIAYCTSPDNTAKYGALLNAIARLAPDMSVPITIPVKVHCEDSSNRKFIHSFDLTYKKGRIPHFRPNGRIIVV